MKKIKLSKKAIIIIASILGFLLFAGLIVILFPQITYVNNVVKETVSDLAIDLQNSIDTDYEDQNNNTEDTSEDEYTTGGGYQSEITFASTNEGFNLQLVPNGSLKSVASPISIFKTADKAANTYDPDDRSLTYEAGVISGTVSVNGATVEIPSQTKYYIAFLYDYNDCTNYPGCDTPHWELYRYPLRYFVYNNEVFIITGSDIVDFIIVAGLGDIAYNVADSDPEDDIDDSYNISKKGILENNVIILKDGAYDYDTVLFNTFNAYYHYEDGSKSVSYYFFDSTKGASFKIWEYSSVFSTYDLSDFTKIDEYKGLTIYEDSRKVFVIKSREGLYYEIEFQMPIDDYDEMLIILNDGSTVSSYYTSSYGTCELDSDPTNKYVFETLDDNAVTAIGTIGNTIIYEKKNISNDTYTKKLYEEDYVDGEYWKYNDLTIDDNTPVSFEDFLSYHPVIYIKDVYGDYIRYASSDFLLEGGCAKPAIYLYPESTTDISVKVVPNGELTFTYPLYNTGWNVKAYPDGLLLNKADGNTYNYLWWDSFTYSIIKPSAGFVVATKDINTFLDEKLSEMNLNKPEKEAFKEYWGKKIQNEDSNYVFVTFLFNEDVNQIAKLEVSPKPENVFRVFMLYHPVSQKYFVAPLNLQSANRDGYTLIEWGGAKF